MLADEPNFMPYAPGNRVVEMTRRIHEGKTPPTLTDTALISLGVPEGNADRVQKTLRFLNLITPEFTLTAQATALRRATSDEYQSVLADLVRGAWEPVFHSYDPATATDLDLNNAFKPFDPAGQRPQMIALFMSLCREAGLAPGEPIRKRGRRPGTTLKQKDPKERVSRNGSTIVSHAPPPVKPGAFSKTVAIAAGAVTLTVSVDLMDLVGDDRTFVFDLIDKLKAHETAHPVLTPASAGEAE